MLLKIMQANEGMKDALLDQNRAIQGKELGVKQGKLGITT
jgi:hypothetical protein